MKMKKVKHVFLLLVDQEIQDKIREYALRVFKAVDGHGLSRVDFFLDKKSNQIYLNEINTYLDLQRFQCIHN